MDDILQLTLLYDFYGELLTEKQKQVYELHYQNDLSLTEIGEELSIMEGMEKKNPDASVVKAIAKMKKIADDILS